MDDGDSADTEPCPNCGKQIYEDGEFCPHCGSVISGTGARRRTPLWIVVGVILCAIAMLVLCLR